MATAIVFGATSTIAHATARMWAARGDSLLLVARDAAKLEAIIAKQMPDAEKRKRADFIVDTSHGLDPVRARIRDILAEVVKMPQRRA